MAEPPYIIVVDDDPEIRSLVARYLEQHQFRVTAVADGPGLDRQLQKGWPDLVILDLMMPGEDGFAICKRLRSRSQLPIIMLTARDEDADQIVGFELGADDYVRKPFNPRALVARIRAVLRRTDASGAALTADSGSGRNCRFGRWHLDVAARRLTDGSGVSIDLNGAEFDLLALLLARGQRVVSRAELMRVLHGRDTDPFDRSIDVRVSRLRQRLGDDARSPSLIKTVYGQGYALGVPVVHE